MTQVELDRRVFDMVHDLIEAHGEHVRIHLERVEAGWQIFVSDPEQDH
jgi:hypothetical protein